MIQFSVVIPLYNKEKHITRAINSILNQKYQPAEIVIVDDGSTDHSVNEVEKFKEDSRIRLIRQKNLGVSAARNNGVSETTNELIAFLDADDEWKPEFLSQIQRLYNNFPDCGAYATAYEIIEQNGKRCVPYIKGIPPAPWIGIIPNLFRMMQYDLPFMPSSVIIPKSVFEEMNGFPIGIKRGEDKILWVRLGMKYPIAYSPSFLAIYHREATNRACHIFDPESQASDLLDKMLKYQEVPSALLGDVTNYNSLLKIQKSQELVKEGEAKLARNLLYSIKKNSKYRLKWIWWYLWSYIPYPLIKFLVAIRIKELDSQQKRSKLT